MKKPKNTKLWRKIALIAGDVLVIGLVYFVAVYATFDLLFSQNSWPLFYYGLIWISTTILAYIVTGVYKMQTDNFGLFESIKLMAVTFSSSVILYIIMFCLHFSSAFSSFPYLNWKSFLAAHESVARKSP
jgi:FlaA1/EpsC-like NDP-sugar epimerase